MREDDEGEHPLISAVVLGVSYVAIALAILFMLIQKSEAAEKFYRMGLIEVRIMDQTCAWDGNKMAGYMKTVDGTLWGCWVFKNDYVWFQAEGNPDVIKFPYDKFQVVIDGTEYKPRRYTKPNGNET